MNIVVKELEGIVGFTQQDGCYLDFREQGEHLFIIDRSLKTLRNNRKYKVTIELITEGLLEEESYQEEGIKYEDIMSE